MRPGLSDRGRPSSRFTMTSGALVESPKEQKNVGEVVKNEERRANEVVVHERC